MRESPLCLQLQWCNLWSRLKILLLSRLRVTYFIFTGLLENPQYWSPDCRSFTVFWIFCASNILNHAEKIHKIFLFHLISIYYIEISWYSFQTNYLEKARYYVRDWTNAGSSDDSSSCFINWAFICKSQGVRRSTLFGVWHSKVFFWSLNDASQLHFHTI